MVRRTHALLPQSSSSSIASLPAYGSLDSTSLPPPYDGTNASAAPCSLLCANDGVPSPADIAPLQKPTLFPPSRPARREFFQKTTADTVQRKAMLYTLALLLLFTTLTAEIHLVCYFTRDSPELVRRDLDTLDGFHSMPATSSASSFSSGGAALCTNAVPLFSQWIQRHVVSQDVQQAALASWLFLPILVYIGLEALVSASGSLRWWQIMSRSTKERLQFCIVLSEITYYYIDIVRNLWSLTQAIGQSYDQPAQYGSAGQSGAMDSPTSAFAAATVAYIAFLCAFAGLSFCLLRLASYFHHLHTRFLVIEDTALVIHLPFSKVVVDGYTESTLVTGLDMLCDATMQHTYGVGLHCIRMRRPQADHPGSYDEIIVCLDADRLVHALDELAEWCRFTRTSR
ncbi:hypothetical protein RI367_005271 [Sorochytrium milnesiophthora]